MDTKLLPHFNDYGKKIQILFKVLENAPKRDFEAHLRYCDDIANDFDRVRANANDLRICCNDAQYTMHRASKEFQEARMNAVLEKVRDRYFGTSQKAKQAYRAQKRSMNTVKCLLNHQTVREYWIRLNELNEYLTYFPPSGTAGTTPAKLDEDEMKEIITYNIPNEMKNACRKFQFDITKKDTKEGLEFLQSIEETMRREYTERCPVPKQDNNSARQGTK